MNFIVGSFDGEGPPFGSLQEPYFLLNLLNGHDIQGRLSRTPKEIPISQQQNRI